MAILFRIGDIVKFAPEHQYIPVRAKYSPDSLWKILGTTHDCYIVQCTTGGDSYEWFHRRFQSATILDSKERVVQKIKFMRDKRKELGYDY